MSTFLLPFGEIDTLENVPVINESIFWLEFHFGCSVVQIRNGALDFWQDEKNYTSE